MVTSILSAPSHLCIFVYDPDTGHPTVRLPLYAEIAVPRIVPRPPTNERWREPVRAALIQLDPDAAAAARDRAEAAAMEALARVFDDESRGQLANDPQRTRGLVRQAFKEVLTATQSEHVADVSPDKLKRLLEAALRHLAREFGLSVVESVEDTGAIWSLPLGVLTTDHVGYCSFDLKRLSPDVQLLLAEAIDARRKDPAAVPGLAIWIFSYGHPGRFDILQQARFTFDAVVARLALTWNTLPRSLINMGPRALQNPSLTDWRLSPASFAASPKTLVGEGGCEELVPSNLALQEFVLRQVVRLSDVPESIVVPDGFKVAYVDDYKVSWYSLGHSLGEILYSLPLAPGETVRLAVIDWSWDSLTERDEKTKLTEDVLHQTHRDRTISETVKAGLRELQHGSSFMGGIASSAGASGSGNVGVFGLGAAVGNAWSLGGSTATSEGSRDLAAENVQRLNDSFSQASSSQREINSTVVIQARQEEKQSIQTRTFSNYNHSHTLTVLYYEVLRHYRVTVEWVRRREAVLVKLSSKLPGVLTAQVLLSRRYMLETFLRDPRLGAAFDAAARFALGEEKLKRDTNKWAATTQTIDPGAKVFVKLIAQFTTTEDDTTEPVFVVLHLHDGRVFEFQCDGAGDEGTSPEFEKTLAVPIMWNQIKGVEVKLKDINSGGDWEETNILITMATATNERTSILADAGTRTLDDAGGTTGLLPSIQPPAPTTTTVGPKPQRYDYVSAEDDLALANLIAHVEANRSYYNNVLLLSTDPNTIAIEFEAKPWTPGQVMADHVDPTPLEVFGSQIAFALAKQSAKIDDALVVDIAAALNGSDPARRLAALDQLANMNEVDRQSVLERLPLASAKSERLISMSTRGVFAEGKLGHCNVSEEIDNTRFWKWEEHPLPIQAPEIGAVQPIQPTPQQVAATPTSFPQALVNVVSPTAAPDPVGLGAALSLLGTPNIFRDMSGRQEVADLLKKLSDNTISIAEAANRARDIQAKYGGTGTGTTAGGTATGEPKTGLGAPRTTPSDRPSTTNQDLKDLQHVLGSAQERSLITPSDAKEAYTNAVKGAYDPMFTVASEKKPVPSVPITPALDTQLGQAAAVEFFDAMDIDNYFRDVTGETFAGWFNSTLAGRGSWGPLAMSIDVDTLNRFAEIWNVFPPIVGSDRGSGANGITIPEFATLMAKFLHETGSRLQFRGAEVVGGYGHPGLSYAFDSFEIQRPGEAPFTKGSYNTGNGNHTAFTCFHDPIFLAAFGTLAPTAQAVRDRNEWKGTAWPSGVPTTLDASTAFIQEADFYKCRGRGAIQSTGRAAYLPIVDFVQTYSGGDSRITNVQQRWSGLATTLAGQGINLTTNDHFLTASSNADWDALFATITIQAVAIRAHNNIPGKHYLPMSNSPAVLRGTARGSAYFVAIAIAGNNPSYGNDVRQRMLEFIGTLWRTPMPTAATGGTIEL